MKPFFYCFLLILLCACGKDKTVKLPEINHSKVSKINDVSPAYLFYDITQPDSVDLNRNNLISTTNWLINVDKRLTLGQAIPKIMFLQDKKRSATMHKNENAKNYYTCNDLSKHTLGFIDFTDVIYHLEAYKMQNFNLNPTQLVTINVQSIDSIIVSFTMDGATLSHTSNYNKLLTHLKTNVTKDSNATIVLEFSKKLSFQDYISLKHLLSKMDLKNVTIARDEFVFN
jgi:biopolymer transport protein ExbD